MRKERDNNEDATQPQQEAELAVSFPAGFRDVPRVSGTGRRCPGHVPHPPSFLTQQPLLWQLGCPRTGIVEGLPLCFTLVWFQASVSKGLGFLGK